MCGAQSGTLWKQSRVNSFSLSSNQYSHPNIKLYKLLYQFNTSNVLLDNVKQSKYGTCLNYNYAEDLQIIMIIQMIIMIIQIKFQQISK